MFCTATHGTTRATPACYTLLCLSQ